MHLDDWLVLPVISPGSPTNDDIHSTFVGRTEHIHLSYSMVSEAFINILILCIFKLKKKKPSAVMALKTAPLT